MRRKTPLDRHQGPTTPKAAFTLVELLVVIGIIALLISILIPTLGRAKQQANLVKCQSNMRSIGQAMQFYTLANQGRLPFGFTNQFSTITGPEGQYCNWALLVQNALSSKYAVGNNAAANDGGNTAKLREIFICPEGPGDKEIDFQEIATVHYACHPLLMPSWPPKKPADPANPDAEPGNRVVWKLSKVPRSSEVALIMEGMLALQSPTNGSGRLVWAAGEKVPMAGKANYRSGQGVDGQGGHGIGPVSEESVSMTPESGSNASINKDVLAWKQNIRFRHKKNTIMNVLMADGHVESFSYDARKPGNDPKVTTFTLRNFNVVERNPFKAF